MTAEKNKQYTIEVSEGEAQRIEKGASQHGIAAPDFVIYCVRALCFNIEYAVKKLAEAGQSGTNGKE
jgi:hypothetical protein